MAIRKSTLRRVINEEIRRVVLTEERVDPKHKKEFQRWASEIGEKALRQMPDMGEKELHNFVRSVIGVIGLGSSNPNYAKAKAYFPDKFDETLVSNGDGNTYDSVWWNQNDTQRDTIIRKGIKGLV